jgi:hypothetical protein
LLTSRSRQIARLFRNYDLNAKKLQTGIDDQVTANPMVVIDHTSYPGVEAHLFTIAHAAQWNARFTDTHDVLLSFPVSNFSAEGWSQSSESNLVEWNRFISILSIIMECLKTYREDIAHGEFATVVWGHHATEWHRELWESKTHDFVAPSEFIEYVDTSIRPHITELNNLGFATMESCSGLMVDHPDRVPYRPYVMFDERSYFGSAPHFFTLGDMAGWESMYAPHGFDVYIRVIAGDDIEKAWSRLILNARTLSPLLASYRLFNQKFHDSHQMRRHAQDEAPDYETSRMYDDPIRRIGGTSEHS